MTNPTVDTDVKVILFIPTLNGGGAERVFVTLANHFQQVGIDLTLVLVQKGGVYTELLNKHVNVEYLQGKGTLTSTLRFISLIKTYRTRYRIVKVISTLETANCVNIISKILLGKRIKSIIREATPPPSATKETGNFAYKLRYFLAKKLYRHSDLFIGCTRALTQESINFYKLNPARTTTIYNPVIDEELYEKSTQQIEEINLFRGEGPVIVAMGRILPVKGFDILIKAFSQLKSYYPNARLLILGSDRYDQDYKNYLNKLTIDSGVSQDILFTGFKKNPFPYIKNSDLFVLSSRFEGLPNALIQAMALEVKVVSTDVRFGPREILENGRLGKLVTAENHDSLAEGMRCALTSDIPPNIQDSL